MNLAKSLNARTIKRGALFLVFFICLWAQITGGIHQTLWTAFPSPRLPSLRPLLVPVSGLDFLLLYGMFSPEERESDESERRRERVYGGSSFALQSRTEIWAELSDGRFTRVTGADYIPDPRDEQILLRKRKLEGDRFPLTLRMAGDTPEAVYGREMLLRYNRLNPGKNAVAIHTRVLHWPAGTSSGRQNHSGLEHHDFPSISELKRDGAWAKERMRRIWPPADQ